MVVGLPSNRSQRKAVLLFMKVVVAAVLTAVVTWRLGLLLGIELNILDTLLLLGLPLVVFFIGGISCITAVAWVVGVLPALAVCHLKGKCRRAALIAGTFNALAIGVTWWQCPPEHSLLLVAVWVCAMIGLSVAFWWLSRFLAPHRLGLAAWEMGVVFIGMLLVLVYLDAPERDLLILLFVAGFVWIVSLIIPRLVLGIAHATAMNGRRLAFLAVMHGAIVSLVVPFSWFAVARGIGWARAAVDIQLLPILGMWLAVACLLVFLGWLVDRGVTGFACAVVLVAALWLASAHVDRGPAHHRTETPEPGTTFQEFQEEKR